MKYLRRVLAIILISVLLAATTGSAFFQAHEVYATAGVDTVGGSALFEFLLGLFGVHVPGLSGGSLDPASSAYKEYLDSQYSAGAIDDAMTAQEFFEGYTAPVTGTVTFPPAVISSVQGFLEEKFGSLTSGVVQGRGKFVVDNFSFHDTYFNSLLSYCSSTWDEFCIFVSYSNDSGYTFSNARYYAADFSSFSFDSSLSTYLVFYAATSYFPTTRQASLISYDSLGMPVSSSPLYSYQMTYSNGWGYHSLGYWGVLAGCSGVYPSEFPFYVNSSFPVIVTDTHFRDELKTLPLNDLLSDASIVSGVTNWDTISFGGYSGSNVDAISDKTLPLKTVVDTNQAVSDAVAANTLEDAETGAITYTDAIAGAVADAIAKALTDAGVIEGTIPGTGEGEGEGEGEETEKPLPWVPDLFGKLDAIKDTVIDGFKDLGEWIMDIPEAIAGFLSGLWEQLWEWLSKIWEAIIALPGAIADAFESFFNPEEPEKPPGGEEEPPDGTPFLAELSQLFPFCIPFDLIRLFSVMQATAQAPYWEIPLDVPSIGLHYTFVIDMSQFDSLAQILRVCETIAFLLGLILVTRKLIKG